MSLTLVQLIHYITWYATERGEALTSVRLVKFLYLADLYFARRNHGKTLTGWPWKFYHYGPYCYESLQAIEEAVRTGLIDQKPYQSAFNEDDYYLYRSGAEPEEKIVTGIPLAILGPLQVAIKRYAGDTYALLDHVYFETEPMMEAQENEFLDFSKAKPTEMPVEIKMKTASKRNLQAGKNIVSKLLNRYKEGVTKEREMERSFTPVYDRLYETALAYLDDQDEKNSVPELHGKAEIVIE